MTSPRAPPRSVLAESARKKFRFSNRKIVSRRCRLKRNGPCMLNFYYSKAYLHGKAHLRVWFAFNYKREIYGLHFYAAPVCGFKSDSLQTKKLTQSRRDSVPTQQRQNSHQYRGNPYKVCAVFSFSHRQRVHVHDRVFDGDKSVAGNT